MNRTKKLGRISLILVAVLVFTAVFNMAYTGFINFGGASVPEGVATANSSIRKSDMNMDSIREQYLNFETVEKNIAAFDGDRWVIVELDASSLYDEFKKSVRFTDFGEYLKSVEAQKVLASLKAKQSRFLNKLDRYGVEYTFKYNYSTLNAGVAIKINASAYNTISAMSEVKGVYYSESYAVPEYTAVENNANVYSTGIYDTDDLVDIDTNGDGVKETYQGQGMAVAILDTGLDRTHDAFNPTEFMGRLSAVDGKLRYTREDIAKLLAEKDFKAEQFGSGVNDVYYNEKVPFAYDYADDDAEVFPGYSNHGTHVAGIVAGQDDGYKVGAGEDGIEDTDDDETFRGVAPLAQLVICKVFTDNLLSDMIGGANDIDIVAALNDCVELGVDVINMSLGTSAGFADEKSQNHQVEVYNRIREMGISLVCAASNDYSSGFGGGNGTNLASNPDSGTVGSPSTYYSALSVASINGKKSKYLQGNNNTEQVAFITNSSDGDGNRIEFIEEVYKQLKAKYGSESNDLRGGKVFDKKFGKKDLNLKYVLVGGVGRPNNFSASIKNQLRSRAPYTKEDGTQVDVDGTVALIKRGDTTFEEKVQEAMSAGADAVIIYNNVSGTINMSLGEINDPVPTCLITMDASAPFVEYARNHNNIGTIQLSSTFEAGPFMSDFSSWGPVSNLTLKPEITAHGGEITSAVPGAYDVLSGTSMASPNMAGAVAVLRQYLQETTKLTGNALNARVNQVLMSTATIARNEEGNPYSPRKQGAGLAGITDAVLSEGYITVKPYGKAESVYNQSNASTKKCIVDGWLDKTKIELFDDPQKEGVYKLQFTVHNTTNTDQKYRPTTYVMTETLASDNRTVAEKAYMLNDMCEIKYESTAYSSADGLITVPAENSVEITVTVKLKQEAKDYFEQQLSRTVIGTNGRPVSVDYKPFENGMYVEGFVSLDNVTYDNDDAHDDGVTLGVPYLAFYGDWTAAPLFDYDIYEVSEIEANSAIDFENKLKTTSLPSQVIGMYHNDDYIIPLGTYLYEMDEEEDDIYPSRDKIALSQYDEEGSYTVYELYAAYAGLLRNASQVKTVVTNAKTGEVVYEEVLGNVGKAYSAGGGNRGAFVRYEINPSKWGWQNNDEFYFKVEGWLDYGKDGNPLDYTKDTLDPAQSKAEDNEILTTWTGKRNTFEFPLTIDYESPQITDYTIRFDSYKEYGVTKYRTYLDLEVYDNQYVMAVLPCFLKEEYEGKTGTYLNLLTEYPIPVYGEKGATSKVSVDITDYYEKYGLKGELFIQVEDYAMNSEVYNITLDEDSLTYPEEKVEFVQDKKLSHQGEGRVSQQDSNGVDTTYFYPIYNLTLNPFELYKLNLPAEREREFILQNLTWRGESDRVIAQGDEIFALAFSESGTDTSLELIDLMDESLASSSGYDPHIYARINVHVDNGKPGNMPSPSGMSFKPVHAGDNHVVNLDGLTSVEVNPNQYQYLPDDPDAREETLFKIEPYISPWYFEAAYKQQNGKEFEFAFETNRPNIATVDATSGVVTFLRKGTATITCKATDPKYQLLTKDVNFIVGEDYYVNNFTLYEWYGDDTVEIPTDVNVLYLDEDCFKNDQSITEVVLPPLLMEIPNFAFQNCKNLKKITIPSQCAYIGPYAFDGCENLETVVFPEYVDANKDPVPGYYGSIAVGHFAFRNCVNLKNFVTGERGDDGELDLTKISHRMTVMYDGAFSGCTGLQSIDLSALRVVGTGVFAGCTGLKSVDLSASTAIGPYMFAGCEKLNNIHFEGSSLPDYAFSGCKGLTDFTFGEQTLLGIGDYALAGTGMTKVTLPAGNYTIGSGAFANSKLTEVTVADGAQLTFTGANPFMGCDSVTFKGNAYKFDEDGALYNIAGDTLISAPMGDADYKLPDTVTTIGDGALSGSAVTTINLTNVKNIGKYAFAGSKLTTVTWPNGLDEIAEGAFSGCAALTSVTNTQTVKKIGAHAFEGCRALKNIALNAVTEVGDYAFYMGSDENTQSKLETINAPELQTIGNYAFAGTAVSSVDHPHATSVGAWAFAYNSKLLSVHLGAVEHMGDHAFFRSSNLANVKLEEGTLEIGDYAFSTFDPYYDNVTIAKLNMLGNPTVKDYTLAYVRQSYMNITPSRKLVSVDLPTTVKKIGAYAFTGQAGLTTIELSKVTDIGDSAFRLCTALANLDLSEAVNIGEYAFYGSLLNTVDLPKAKVIGKYAFAGSGEVTLSYGSSSPDGFDFKMERTILGGNIKTLTLGAVERIGDFAFAGNQLSTVEIPASMDASTYEFVEWIYDDKGREERYRTRIGNTFGAGVFAYNPNLTSITVAKDDKGNDNPAFTSIDGVLYSYKFDENGEKNGMLELVQYPTGVNRGLSFKSGTYTVADNTVAIAASAFEGVNTKFINGVVFPYTLKLIGSSAFYGTSAKRTSSSNGIEIDGPIGIMNYTFNSVQAPTLVAANDDLANEYFKGMLAFVILRDEGYYPWSIDSDGEQYIDLENISITALYSNFVDYAYWSGYGNVYLSTGDDNSALPQIKFTVPKNGVGYDSALYKAYVFEDNLTLTENNMPDDATYEAINKIEALATLLEGKVIQNLSKEEIDVDSEIGKAMTAARDAYNKVTNADQIALLENYNKVNYYEKLLGFESELREARASKGITVTLTSVDVQSQPAKIRYNVGEKFDPSGMVIRVRYSDGSEIRISADNFEKYNVKITNDIIEAIDPNAPADPNKPRNSIEIVYTDAFTGQTTTLYITINVNSSSGPSGPSDSGNDPSDPANAGGGLPTWAIAIIAVGAALVAAAVATTVILVLKKKGKGAKSAKVSTPEASSDDSSENQETSSDDGAESDEE